MAQTRVCACEGGDHPLPRAAFCDDDLYCPQCGNPVHGLESDSLQPGLDSNRPTLWIYPSKRRDRSGHLPEFRFTLRFWTRDAIRSPHPRPLVLDAERCAIRMDSAFFDAKIDLRPGEDKVECVLRPLPLLIDGQCKILPTRGAAGELSLSGSCGEGKRLDLLVFNEPVMRFSVEGEGVQPFPPNADVPVAWSLGRGGEQNLTLRLWPANCLIYLPRPPAGQPDRIIVSPQFSPGGSFEAKGEADQSAILGPTSKATVHLTFDVEDWEHDDRQKLTVGLDPATPSIPIAELEFFRQAVGDLECPNIEFEKVLYFGERLEIAPGLPRELFPLTPYIKNIGQDLLTLSQPEVRLKDSPEGVDWIQVEFAEGEDSITLEEQDRSELHVVIDLTRLRSASYPDGGDKKPLREGESLVAEIVFRQTETGRTWTRQLMIPEVRTRPYLRAPLAVDFGNTNTFAATNHPERKQLEGILGDPDPETFPSAIYFTNLPVRGQPSFEIGVEASQRGKIDDVQSRDGQDGRFLVVGLKRELSRRREAGETTQFVFPRVGAAPAKFTDVELIEMFLERVLLECEKRLRSTVVQVGFSYPANFSPDARQKLDGIIEKLAKSWGDRYDHYRSRIRFHALNSDEASAVALGFVFDKDQFQRRIKPLLAKKHKRFLVASFDFGGGSVDCALIRFDFTGDEDGLPSFDSRPLGIGGHEHFGGDNVTVAVYELVVARLRALLAPLQVTLPLADLGVSGYRSRYDEGWRNRQVIWDGAEALKRYGCLGSPGEADRLRIDGLIQGVVARLFVRRATGSASVVLAMSDGEVGAKLTEAVGAGSLLVPLAEIESHQVRRDFRGESGYTIAGRLTECVDKLASFVKRAVDDPKNGFDAGLKAPHFVVLAGAGCRFPLARKLLEKAFPGDSGVEFVEDDRHPKSKVAFGLFRYLDLFSRNPDNVNGLEMARDFTHADIVWSASFDRRIVWIPSCTKVNDPRWFKLANIGLAECWDSNHRIILDRGTANEPEPFGCFDLKKEGIRNPDLPGADEAESPVATHSSDPGPAPAEEDAVARSDSEWNLDWLNQKEERFAADITTEPPKGPIPRPQKGGPPQIEARLNGAENLLILRVNLNGKIHGYWKLEPLEPEAGPGGGG